MHISDGIYQGSALTVVAVSAVATAGLAGTLLAKLDGDRIPRVALCTSFFFVASLVHVPLGPTSIHLLMIGLIGIIMGPWAFLPVLFGLTLQALLFQHGGITTIGVNALIMGLPAYGAYGLFRAGSRVSFRGSGFAFGFIAGAAAVVGAAALLGFFLSLAGGSFRTFALWSALAQLPLAPVEGVVTGFAVELVGKTAPGLLEAGHA